MDWEKVGQAFQGGANVLAGGLMDKYQRQKDLQDWEQKQRLASQIQTGEREQEHAFQFWKQTREFTLDGIKNDLKTNPELIPYALKAEQGDEGATRILSIYAGAKYQMDQKTPLTSDDLALLKDLPPQTRHVIINRHLTTLNEESKRRADLEAVQTRTERDRAMTKKALEDTQDNSGLYGDYAIEKKVRDAAEKQKKADIESTVKDINSLNSRIMSKKAELARSLASKAQAAADSLIQELDRLSGLRDDAIVRRDGFKSEGSEEQARQKWATEPTAKPPAQETPANVVENIALTPEDMEEIAAAKKARPDLSEEAIIKAYVAYKRKTKSPAKGLSPTAGLRER